MGKGKEELDRGKEKLTISPTHPLNMLLLNLCGLYRPNLPHVRLLHSVSA